MRTSYEFLEDAQADGWRRINRSIDVDVSGGNWVGYRFKAPDGQLSTTISITQESNKLSALWGCCLEMINTTTTTQNNGSY